MKIKLELEHIKELLRGRKIIFNEVDFELGKSTLRVEILPPQEGMFFTREQLNNVIADRTNVVDRLLKMIEANK